MIRVLALALALAPVSVGATDIGAMTEEEREAFRNEVREYLLENPEIIMEAVQVLEERRNLAAAQREQEMLDQNREEIFNDGYSYVGGNPDGDVTIVEFLDYRCGFCKRAFPEVEELIATDGNIRFIVKEFPILGPASTLGSQYAIAVKNLEGDDAYKFVHDELMQLRSELNDAALSRLSKEYSFDHDAILAEMGSEEVTRIIDANRELGNRLEIQGTPTFVMGENFVRGYVDLAQMRAIVDAIRAEQEQEG